MIQQIEALTTRLQPYTTQIINHPLYQDLVTVTDLQLFMNQHVFAVWDFMCLLKELQRRLVSTSAPWFPPKDAMSANLINSILVEEEGDITEDGSYASHFDMYLSAMEKIGADINPIKKLLQQLMNGATLLDTIDHITMLPSTKQFVLTTFAFFEQPLHELAAAFVYAREGVTAAMFTPILEQIQAKIPGHEKSKLSTLIYYFKRHIVLDNDEHFPKALRMLSNIIGDDEQKLIETENAAVKALNARIEFFNGIHQYIQQQ